MARSFVPQSSFLFLLLGVIFLASPAHAFGAGNISTASGLDGYNWRHGDIVDVLLALPISFASRQRFTNLDVSGVYFGNWLRDFSQLLDAGTLGTVPEPLLRAIVSVLGFLEFGYTTGEFDVTAKRLGVYRPEEHIDNPLGYDSKGLDKLRGPVQGHETQIDEVTGMKNYIANDKIGITTSSGYIRKQLLETIRLGRLGKTDENAKREAFIHLGAALHTLEDFAAHSNYVELALLLIGKKDPSSGLDRVFPFVGEAVSTPTAQGPAPPIVTGTFGPLDLYQSILGEIDDKTAARNLRELDMRLPLDVDVGSIAAMLKTVLSPLTFLSIIPKSTIDQIDALRMNQNSTDQGKASVPDWGELQRTPNMLWNAIEPAFQLRDDIARWVNQNLAIPMVKEVSIQISDLLDRLIFALLAIYMKPVLETTRKTLSIEKDRLAEKDKSAKKGTTIFSAGSTVSDPTHSQLAKDHFDNILNPAAGLVATVITNLTTQAIVRAWDDPNLPSDTVIENIVQALHHPFNGTPASAIQLQMFAVVKRWWDSKSDEDKTKIRTLLSKQTIEKNENHIDPEEFNRSSSTKGPAQFEGSSPATLDPEKTLAEKILDMVSHHPAFADGQKAVETLLKLAPTPDNPNPIDRALSEFVAMGGDVVQVVGNTPISQIKAAANLGNLAKDVIVSQLSQVEREVDKAVTTVVSGLGSAATDVVGFFKKPFGWSW